MIEYQNSSSGFVNCVQKRDEQTMDSLQPRDQVVDRRAEPDEKRPADSSMVRCRSDHLSLLCLWTIRMRRLQNKGRTASTIGTHVETISVQSSPPESPVVSRGEAAATSVRVSIAVPSPSAQTARKQRHVSVTPSASRGLVVVPPKKPPDVAWFQRCFWVSLLFGVPSRRKSGLNEPDPHPNNFPSSNDWYKRGGRNCNDGKHDVSPSVDGRSDVFLGPFGACDSWG